MRKYAPRILLLIVSTLLALTAGELVTRKARPDLCLEIHPEPFLGWASEEYLAIDPTVPGQPGMTRLLFLGDSFLAGAGLTHVSDRFPILLARNLVNAQVQIMASGGWGADQELLAFLQKGRLWRPDLVFLCFCSNNDLSNDLSNSHGSAEMMKPYFLATEKDSLELFSSRGQPLTIPDPIPMRTRAPFRLYLLDNLRYWLAGKAGHKLGVYAEVDPRYQLFMRAPEVSSELYDLRPMLSWSPQDGINHVSAYIHEPFPLNTYQWRLFGDILERLQAATKAIDAQLVVVLLPVTYKPADPDFIVGGSLSHEFITPTGNFTFRAAEPAERLRRLCDDLGIVLCDPSADFKRHIVEHNLARQCWPDPHDRHFSAVGHRIVAQELREFLKDRFPDIAQR